jgi:hypothetical protein
MLILIPANLAGAAEESSTKGDGERPAVVESKVSEHGKDSPCLGACLISFRKELGLSFDYLDALGLRIHEAAERPDPVDLAAAATSLAVAESVSGKKASVTADQLLDEAVKLAKQRENADELKAIALLVKDEDVKEEISELAEAARDKKREPGEGSREIFGTLEVINHTNECLRILVDGRYVGEAHEGETALLHVHSHRNPNHLSAICMEGGELIEHAHYFGHAHRLQWHIHH